jgi:hypothetical protein
VSEQHRYAEEMLALGEVAMAGAKT